jgi:hypothetical protein
MADDRMAVILHAQNEAEYLAGVDAWLALCERRRERRRRARVAVRYLRPWPQASVARYDR